MQVVSHLQILKEGISGIPLSRKAMEPNTIEAWI